MSLTSLIKIRDVSRGVLAEDDLKALLEEVAVPLGGEPGECLNWVMRAVEHLAARKVVTLLSSANLREEFSSFCSGNRAFARRELFPNVMVSQNCF